MKFRLLVVVLVAVVLGSMPFGCTTKNTTAPTPTTVEATPDPCACDHGTMVVKKGGAVVTHLAPYEIGNAVVTSWINKFGKEIDQAACPWPGRYTWEASGGGCAYGGDPSQSSAEFACTRSTLDTDRARLTARRTDGCIAEYRLLVCWDCY